VTVAGGVVGAVVGALVEALVEASEIGEAGSVIVSAGAAPADGSVGGPAAWAGHTVANVSAKQEPAASA